MDRDKTLIGFGKALHLFRQTIFLNIDNEFIFDQSHKELYNLTENGSAFESELYEDIEYINNEYKKFKRRLNYLKQKEKLNLLYSLK